MNYSLGNMLCDSVKSLNADKLSLNLQFAADKSLTARKGPTPVFTRASTAHYYAPLIDISDGGDGSLTAIPTLGITNGRASWSKSVGGTLISCAYDGTKWSVSIDIPAGLTVYNAATGSEFRPDQANWSGSGITVTTSSTFGLVKAAINEPRFDHDPVTLASLGLLIEESRTNLLLRSETFQTTWTASQLNTTGTPAYLNVATAPDGTTTADKIIATAVAATHQFRQSLTLVSGTTYSLTCYFKAAEQQLASFQVFGVANGNADWVSLFNVSSTPSTGYSVGFTSTSVTNAGNGWIRCTAIFTATASGSLEFRIGGAGNLLVGGHVYLGNGTSGILVWGAQVEAGSFPTSYIPTTTASVVRSADLCSISGSNFTGFWNQSAGTLVETFEASPNTNTTYASASNGDIVQNSLHLDNDTGLMRAVYYSGSANVATLDLGAVGTVGTVNTIATAYSVNDFAASRNGGTVVTDTSGAVPASLSQINIGTDERSQTPTSFYSNRCIKSLRYYKKRLANAKLQTLST